MFYFIADWHALPPVTRIPEIRDNVREMLIDWLSAGPIRKAVIFRQSDILSMRNFLLLGMITPIAWLGRCPTFKDQLGLEGRNINTFGFLGYPALQATDILAYRAAAVPVGKTSCPISSLRGRWRAAQYLMAGLSEPQTLLSKFTLVQGWTAVK